MNNLETYLRKNCEQNVIDHALRAEVAADGAVSFYIHPNGVDGETLDYRVAANTLTPKFGVAQPRRDWRLLDMSLSGDALKANFARIRDLGAVPVLAEDSGGSQKTFRKGQAKARTPRQRVHRNGQEPDVQRSPPHSVDGEQGVISSMLIAPKETIPECVEKITDEYFYVPAHRTIYEVLVDLWKKGAAIDLITFTQVLSDRNVLDSVGGPAFITSLQTFVPKAANVGFSDAQEK